MLMIMIKWQYGGFLLDLYLQYKIHCIYLIFDICANKVQRAGGLKERADELFGFNSLLTQLAAN